MGDLKIFSTSSIFGIEFDSATPLRSGFLRDNFFCQRYLRTESRYSKTDFCIVFLLGCSNSENYSRFSDVVDYVMSRDHFRLDQNRVKDTFIHTYWYENNPNQFLSSFHISSSLNLLFVLS